MRMKMFAAKTYEDAKAMIFAEMGEGAVILSEREVDGGVEVRAATDKMGGGMVPAEPLFPKRFENPDRPRMVGLRSVSGGPIPVGAVVVDPADPDPVSNELGWVSATTWSPAVDAWIALGFVRRGPDRHGEQLEARSYVHNAEVPVEVTPPCFVDPEGERMHG